jgi:RND family efflux transporter MFP subunit
MPLSKRPLLLAVGAALVLALAGGGYRLSARSQAAPKAAPKTPLVSVTASRLVDIPIDLPAQGHVVPLNFVDIRPQLNGIVRSVDFKEGDDVKAGQLLFTLDDSDARAQLAKADAQSANVAAQLADARREQQRAQTLVAAKFVAPSTLDTATGKAEALSAQLRAAGADAASARTQLGYLRIVSPIAGRAGAVSVHRGSLAQTGAAAPLVTIAQFSPVGVEFSLPERDLPAVLAARDAGAVSVAIDGSTDEMGKLTFINNAIDTATATINLKASFANPRARLWPGGFTRVIVHAGTSRGAVVLPPQAVQDGPAGRFVFTVGADAHVTARPVELLRVQDQLAVVRGLAAGEQVVLEGGKNLRSGMAVKIAPAVASTTKAVAAAP